MNRIRWLKAVFISVLMFLMSLGAAPPALATAGSTWCPLLATAYGSPPACTPLSSSLQVTVNEAKADGRPGNIYALGGTTFNENVVADKLKGVIFTGGVAGGTTTITGSMTISNGSMIAFDNFTVSGGITILNAKGAHQLYGNSAAVDVRGGKFSSGTISDGVSTWPLINALRIYNHAGNITLTNVTAIKAVSNGAVLGSIDGSTIKVNQSKFTANKQTGLVVSGGSGPITLTDVIATGNSVYGAYVLTTGLVPLVVTTAKTRLNHFDKNGNCGLQASAAGGGPLQVADISASKNGQCGAQLFANTGSILVTTLRSRGNHFDRNKFHDGLDVNTNGAVTLADISASRNGEYGAQIGNTNIPSSLALGTLHGKRNVFDRNTGSGLKVTDNGNASLANISASRNGSYGALINGVGAFSLSATKGRNTFDRNGTYGLYVISGTGQTVADVSASRNGGFGAQFVAAASSINLSSGVSRLNSFDKNGRFGLYVISGTGQTVTDVSASKNATSGADLTNLGAGGITVLTSKSKQNQFNSNGDFGIYGTSASGFDIHNTTASKNGTGIFLSATSGNATLTCSTAKSNTANGIYVDITGTLFLKSFVATGNSVNINLASGTEVDSTVSCPS